MDINNSTLVGRITRDLELKKTPNGSSVLNFNLASNRMKIKGADKEEVDFIDCVAWNHQANAIYKYCKKGSKILIVGRIQKRFYDDKDGKRIYITEILINQVQFLDNKTSSVQKNNSPGSIETVFIENEMNGDFANETLDIASDDLPF